MSYSELQVKYYSAASRRRSVPLEVLLWFRLGRTLDQVQGMTTSAFDLAACLSERSDLASCSLSERVVEEVVHLTSPVPVYCDLFPRWSIGLSRFFLFSYASISL